MNKSNRLFICGHVFGLALTFFALTTKAAQINLTAGDAPGKSSFNSGLNWSDGLAPSAGNDYLVPLNKTLRTPEQGTSHIFAGNSLTIEGDFTWKGPNNGSFTVNNLILKKNLYHGNGNNICVMLGNISIPQGENALIRTGAVTENDRREFRIEAPISGSGKLNLLIPRPTGDMRNIHLYGNNSNFTGAIKAIGEGKITITNEFGLGGNPAVFNPKQLELTGLVLRLDGVPEIVLDDPNRGIWLSNDEDSNARNVKGARFEVGAGKSAVVDCLISGPGPFIKYDYGTLTLNATNAYTGTTTVNSNGGLLRINGSEHATASVTVKVNAALGGTGTLDCPVTLEAGAKIDLSGNGFGTLTLNDANGITFNGATLALELQAPADGTSDKLALNGPLNLVNESKVAITLPESGLPAGSYTLVSCTAVTGNGTLSMVTNFPNATLSINSDSVTLQVVGSGTQKGVIWQGDGTANAWDFTTLNWLPLDATFANQMNVLFDDSGDVALPVTLSNNINAQNITVATTNKIYILDSGSDTLSAAVFDKFGVAALTMRGNHNYGEMNVGVFGEDVTGGGGAVTLDGNLTIRSGGYLTVRPSAQTFTQNAQAVISGSGGVTFGNTANLYGTNTFEGITTIGYQDNVKNITLYNAKALGSTNSHTILRGGTDLSYNKLILAPGVTIKDELLVVTGGASRRAGLWMTAAGSAVWDGNIVIKSDGHLQIGSDNSGGILDIGSLGRTTITNEGTTVLYARSSGTVRLCGKMVSLNAALGRDDKGTLEIHSASNTIKELAVPEGLLRLHTDNAFENSPRLTLGKGSDTNIGNKSAVDLNGHDLTLDNIQNSHGDGYNGTPNEGQQYISNSGTIATLTVNGTGNSNFEKVGSIISGAINLVKSGSGTMTLGQANTLSGAIVVSNGTLKVSGSGTLGDNAKSVVVAGGTLSLESNGAISESAAVTFAEGGSGKINLPAGVVATVSTLWHGAKQRYGGTYGANGSGAQYIDNTRFSGTGLLRVLHGNSGTMMILY